jgi:hypothetical protein
MHEGVPLGVRVRVRVPLEYVTIIVCKKMDELYSAELWVFKYSSIASRTICPILLPFSKPLSAVAIFFRAWY